MERNRIYRDAIRRSGHVDSVSGPSGPSGPAGPSSLPWSSGQYVVACVDQDNVVLVSNDATADFGIAPTMAAALTAAKSTAFATFQQVQNLLVNKFGNGATLVVLGCPKIGGVTYLKPDGVTVQDMDWTNYLTGWKRIVRRGTNDFVNDANDKIVCGYQTVPSTNSAGYNPVGATTSLIPCQLAGGGAANLPPETQGVSAITWKRIRFDAATTTVALRNFTAAIYRNDAGTIVPHETLPGGTIADADVFYIEEPALKFGSLDHSHPGADNATLAGVTGATINVPTVTAGSNSTYAGNESAGGYLLQNSSNAVAKATYADETGTLIRVGFALRALTSTIFSNCYFATVEALGNLSATSQLQLVGSIPFQIGAGSYLRCGLQLLQTGGAAPMSAANVASLRIGNNASTTLRRTRFFKSPATQAAIANLSSAALMVRGVDISNFATPLVSIKCPSQISLNDIVSTDGGNSDVVLDMQFPGCIDANVTVGLSGEPITASASLGDIRMGGGEIATFAQLALSNVVDANGNNVQGAAGKVI